MNKTIEVMLSKYHPQSNLERENAIKEIIQEIVLAGLSRGGFFDRAVFYGGTCLRIFHGLNRFSEDLDFALISKDENFRLDDYFPSINKELFAYGISMDVITKKKNDENANIETAFLKGNTVTLLLHFFPNSEETKDVIGNQKLKIKIEVDTANPEGGISENKYRLFPAPYQVRVFNESTLFSGKVHAIICRSYSNHVKGRDYYDYLFYRNKNTKLNLAYLENKLKMTGKLKEDEHLTIEMVKNLLAAKFETLDYKSAKEDVSNFILDKASLDFWGPELFLSTLEGLK